MVSPLNGAPEWFGFTEITVGGFDAAREIVRVYRDADREDVQYIVVSGYALAWYNIVNLKQINDCTDTPAVSLTYEDSPGLENSIRREFTDRDREKRLELYTGDRVEIEVGGDSVYVRSEGVEVSEVREMLNTSETEAGHPVFLRTAKLAARGVFNYREPGTE